MSVSLYSFLCVARLRRFMQNTDNVYVLVCKQCGISAVPDWDLYLKDCYSSEASAETRCEGEEEGIL